MKINKTIRLTITALMAALLCITAPIYIALPFSAVPVTLATFAIYLSSGILGRYLGSMSVVIYLLLGVVGVPVFAGWSGGIDKIVGPTGGYLFGYIIIAFVTGLCAEKSKGNIIITILGMIIGTIGCYVLGTIWLGIELNLSAKEALFAGVLPFIPGDLAKIIVASLVVQPVRKQVMNNIVYE